MAIMTYYRGVEFIKNYFQHYLTGIFMAAQKGSLTLTNGFKEIKFSRTPEVVKRMKLDYRRLPAVLVGPARGDYIYRSIAKDLVYIPEETEPDENQYRFYGGDIRLTLDFDIRSTTAEERDNMVDTVCIYLAHPDAKDFFQRHAIVLEKPPSISGERELYEPGIDMPIYSTVVSIYPISVWQIKQTLEDRLEDLFVDIDFELVL
jgi:hypothetical protein